MVELVETRERVVSTSSTGDGSAVELVGTGGAYCLPALTTTIRVVAEADRVRASPA